MDSSLIRSALYWPDHRAMELCLASGRRYLYLGVPPELAEGFQRAASKGGYFNRHIKGRFDCHPLRDEPPPKRRAANDRR
jgi:lysyl-tRNA synthetase class 2